MASVAWAKNAQDIFDKVIGNLPQFHRSIAEHLVKESAEAIAGARDSRTVEEEDLIKAFFCEVPPAFRDMMRRLFQQLEVPYKQYIEDGDD
ncbi:MAG: hypothetical protein JXD21_01880 [Candidatus Omnitrophica bacterium]|nr:hypothetical protein [Candidatus Omnitrophota bacterium]